MKLDELYKYYGNNWQNVVRELKIGSNTIYKWRQRGHIPIKSQMVIEKRTGGLFKARTIDAEV